MTTTVTGVSTSVLPIDKCFISFNCPTLPTPSYGLGSKTLDRTNAAARARSPCASAPSTSASTSSYASASISKSCRFASSSSGRYAACNASARLRWFSKPQPRGVRQLQVLNHSSRHLKREWEKRCCPPQDGFRLASERAVKSPQHPRNAVFGNARPRCPVEPQTGHILARTHRSLHSGDRSGEWRAVRGARSRRSSRVARRDVPQCEHRLRHRRQQQQQSKRFTPLQSCAVGHFLFAKKNWRPGASIGPRKRSTSEARAEDDPERIKKARRQGGFDMPESGSSSSIPTSEGKFYELSNWPKPSAGVNVYQLYDCAEDSDRAGGKSDFGGVLLNGEEREGGGEVEDRRTIREDRGQKVGERDDDDVESPTSSASAADAKMARKFHQTDEGVVQLKNYSNGAEVYIVGTSHVSRKSVKEVQQIIEKVRPNYVLVELCRQRYDSLELRKTIKKISLLEHIIEKLTKGRARLLGAALSRMQPHHSSYPGQEFQVAMEAGKRVGAEIVLGDQEIEKTLMLLGDFDLNMSMQDAFRLFGQPMPPDMAKALGRGQDVSKTELFERFRDRRVVRRFNEEMKKGAPHIHKILVDDRNEIMAKRLRSLPGKVVAVVGLAHVDGLEQLWHEYNEKC
ncbi:hypothetical protein MPTK1_5g13460 [Marchantia polymorpha subsp. ruderalis]|uniref:TraB domain-containing protein n=2 Tax=Marchantia polymorpha TaxID=3197 RepID=A0AAF6BHY6_MARPO|nr:hypothetical protein MARPO_0032s0039 [Marchantia polymorpha]BBN11620.1 hypothetical protein Mp_5g13460 [Marchantia polymorpha subsp. ruderalis]|eukprot:PTQ41835.1 hypothetical protein MARPO_0032s0039 [Marchantia polymorpha]